MSNKHTYALTYSKMVSHVIRTEKTLIFDFRALLANYKRCLNNFVIEPLNYNLNSLLRTFKRLRWLFSLEYNLLNESGRRYVKEMTRITQCHLTRVVSQSTFVIRQLCGNKTFEVLGLELMRL